MKERLYFNPKMNFKRKIDSLYLNNLDLPIILPRKNSKNKDSNKISNSNPNLKRRIEEYKIKNNFKLPKLESHSIRYHQIVKTENMKELAQNYLRSNKNIFSYLKVKNGVLPNEIIKTVEKTEKNNIYGNKIKKMIRLHSSKYHKGNIDKNKSNDEFDIMLNKLKYGSYNLDIDDREIKYRQRLAFKYRFLNSEKNVTPINIQKMNLKMNKLLILSKSIPNYLSPNINFNESKKDEDKKNELNISVINKKNFSSINSKKNKSYTNKVHDNNAKSKSEENIKLNKSNNIITHDKNGKKFIPHLSLLL